MNMKVFYKLIPSLLVDITRHAQSIRNNKFLILQMIIFIWKMKIETEGPVIMLSCFIKISYKYWLEGCGFLLGQYAQYTIYHFMLRSEALGQYLPINPFCVEDGRLAAWCCLWLPSWFCCNIHCIFPGLKTLTKCLFT